MSAGGGPMKSVQPMASKSKIAGAVAGAAAAIYVLWEVRVRASAKMGKVPRTLTHEWQRAQDKRMTDMELQGRPDVRVFLNPHRHSIPPSMAVRDAS